MESRALTGRERAVPAALLAVDFDGGELLGGIEWAGIEQKPRELPSPETFAVEAA